MPSLKGYKKKESSQYNPTMISFTQSLTQDHYRRLAELAKQKGMQYPQDLIRISVSELLEKSGY